MTKKHSKETIKMHQIFIWIGVILLSFVALKCSHSTDGRCEFLVSFENVWLLISAVDYPFLTRPKTAHEKPGWQMIKKWRTICELQWLGIGHRMWLKTYHIKNMFPLPIETWRNPARMFYENGDYTKHGATTKTPLKLSISNTTEPFHLPSFQAETQIVTQRFSLRINGTQAHFCGVRRSQPTFVASLDMYADI